MLAFHALSACVTDFESWFPFSGRVDRYVVVPLEISGLCCLSGGSMW